MKERQKDLLEYDLSQGWGPLCHVLGKTIPKQDFPQSNDIDSFIKHYDAKRREQLFMMMKFLVLCIVGIVAVGGGILWAVRNA